MSLIYRMHLLDFLGLDLEGENLESDFRWFDPVMVVVKRCSLPDVVAARVPFLLPL